jgi:NADH-quinone oxidoreductase subunit E
MAEKNLIPVLQRIQEKFGYLPVHVMEEIARDLGIPAVQVYGAATFFKQFRLNPPGKHQIQVCMGTACYMAGGQIALDSFERRLKIRVGETTPDGEFSLERVACVGCCNLAPVAVIDNIVEKNATPTRVDGILLSLGVAKEKQENDNDKKE